MYLQCLDQKLDEYNSKQAFYTSFQTDEIEDMHETQSDSWRESQVLKECLFALFHPLIADSLHTKLEKQFGLELQRTIWIDEQIG